MTLINLKKNQSAEEVTINFDNVTTMNVDGSKIYFYSVNGDFEIYTAANSDTAKQKYLEILNQIIGEEKFIVLE